MLVCLVGMSCPGPSWAQDPRLAGLRDVTWTQVSVGTFPNRDPAAPCLLDHGALEHRAAEALRSAGLQVLTATEALERHRRNGEAIDRALDAQRRGERLPGPDSDEVRQRRVSIEFMKNLPGLRLQFVTAPVAGAGGLGCALAVSASFRVFPA
jgi:hypothetical protein